MLANSNSKLLLGKNKKSLYNEKNKISKLLSIKYIRCFRDRTTSSSTLLETFINP